MWGVGGRESAQKVSHVKHGVSHRDFLTRPYLCSSFVFFFSVSVCLSLILIIILAVLPR